MVVVLLLGFVGQLIQCVLHLSIAVINDLIQFINNLYKAIPLQIEELLVALDQPLLIVLRLVVHLQRLLQVYQAVLFCFQILRLFV